MKNITQFISEYYFNKNLNENHYTINEGIMDWLKDFWSWLKNDDNRKEFNIWDSEYDEKEKKKYIGEYDTSVVKIQPAKDLNFIKEIIKKEKPEDSKKGIFSKTEAVINKLGENAQNAKWVMLFFNTDDLKECAGIIGYFEKSKLNEDAIECVDIDINKIYSGLVDLGTIRDTLVKIARKLDMSAILFKDIDKSTVTKLQDEYSFDLTELKSNKGYYIHEL